MLFDGESSVAGPDVHAALLHWYHVPEMCLMLALAGYERVLVTQTDLRIPYVGDYRGGPIIFQAWAM